MISLSIVFVLATSACTSVKISQDLLPWHKSGDLLFEDDFKDQTSGWEINNNAYELKGYSSEGYLISIKTPNARSWSTSGLYYSNTNISAQIQKIIGPADTNFGLICRYVDTENFYSFLISSDGYFGIVRTLAGESKLINSDKFTYSELIHQDNSLNQIDISCTGDQLSLEVNGSRLAAVKDGSIFSGDVGIILETRAGGPASVLFNQFKVTKP